MIQDHDDFLHGAGGGSRETTRTPDSLLSQDHFELVIGLCEGPIKGLVTEHNAMENFFVADTPVFNVATGQANFPDFTATIYPGEDTDPAITLELGGQSVNVPVNVSLTSGTNVVRTTPSLQRGVFDRIEVRIYFNYLARSSDDGTFEATAQFKLQYKASSSSTWLNFRDTETISITGKTVNGYPRDFAIEVPKINADYDLRVVKVSPDGTQGVDDTVISITWESYQLINRTPVQHPGLAMVHIKGLAGNQFSSLPEFAGIYDGLIVRVPTNYNPDTRTYDESVPWNGTFKQAYTNNGVWILYELITNTSFGLARYRPSITVNRYEFYDEAKWVDQMVDDGLGGTQPRFTLNELATDARIGMEFLGYIAGSFNAVLLDDGNGVLTISSDRPRTPSQIFTPLNITPDGFAYSFTEVPSRYNEIKVKFINPELGWAEDSRYASIDNADQITKHGRIPFDFIAVGCTNGPEAVRRANLRYISANYETTSVTFTTSRQGLLCRPLETIYVCDPLPNWGAPTRVKSVAGAVIQLDRPVFAADTNAKTVRIQTYTGLVTRTVVPPATGLVYSLTITAGGAFPSNVPDRTTIVLTDTANMGAAKPYRITRMEEVEGRPDQIGISAIEVAEGKHEQAIAGTEYVPSTYSYVQAGDPTLPDALFVESPTPVITSDGTLVYQIEASWRRPPVANTSRYEIDYRMDGEGSWTTKTEYGDRTFIGPVKDGADYTVRLYAVSLSGVRSRRYLEQTITVAKKTGTLPALTGLDVVKTSTGWSIVWDAASAVPDIDYVDIRVGTTGQSFASLPTKYRGQGTSQAMPWLVAGTTRISAKIVDTSGNSSAAAATKDVVVQVPATPTLTVTRGYDTTQIGYQDCTTTQPLREVQVRTGAASSTWATASDVGSAGSGQRVVTVLPSATTITKVYLKAIDVAGNESNIAADTIPPAAGDVSHILSLVEGQIGTDALAPGLLTRINLIDAADTVAGSVAARVLAEANARASAITSEAASRATADSQLQTNINTLSASTASSVGTLTAAIQDEATARSSADSAEATARTTLATQMRGAYTGTDITQVTTGLIYAERQARVTAVDSVVSSVTSLSATVTGNYNTLSSAITTADTARANGDSSLAQRISYVTASMVKGVITDDPEVRAGTEFWTFPGQLSIVAGSVSGRYAFRATSQGEVFTRSTYPVNAARAFRVRGRFRSGGSAPSNRIAYLAVALLDASGANITGDGTYWLYPSPSGSNPGTSWVEWSGYFGYGTARTFPSNAVFMRVGAILMYDGGGATLAGWQEAENLFIEDAESARLDAAISTEQSARVSQDSAIATQITNLTATVNSNNTTLAAAVSSEATARATADGHLGAQWVLKVALQNGGTLADVGGIAIAGTSTGTAGSRFDMAFRSNAFYFLPPDGQGNTTFSPMTYYTTPTVVNGITLQPGLYLRSAFIETVTAQNIDARGLVLRDLSGNVIFGYNASLDFSRITPSSGWLNSNVSLSSDGSLQGAGGGQVTSLKVVDSAYSGAFGARDRNDAPSEYPVGNMRQFKHSSSVGLDPTLGSFCTLETIKQYGDSAGGGIYQYAYQDTYTWRRRSTNPAGAASTWGTWTLDLDRNSYLGDLSATRDIVLVAQNGVAINGNKITKTGATGAWDGAAKSKEGYVRGCYARFTFGPAGSIMAGISYTPDANSTYARIQLAMYRNASNALVVYESGDPIIEAFGNGVVQATDIFEVQYDGLNIIFTRNAVPFYRRAKVIDSPMYFATNIYETGTYITDIKFVAYPRRTDTNILDPRSWRPDTSGSQPGFNQLAFPAETETYTPGSNSIIFSTGPNGERTHVWRAVADALVPADGNAEGGYNTEPLPIDNTMPYRFSTWIRASNGTTGQFYLGPGGSSVRNLGTPGAVNTNPYFFGGNRSFFTPGKWYLLTGYVYPTSYDGTTNLGGIYDGATGEKLAATSESFRWHETAKETTVRCYQYYTSAVGTTTDWTKPRLDVCDGTEPTLDELLALGAVSGRNPMTAANVGVYMAAATIGWAQIGNLVISTSGAIRSGKTSFTDDTNAGYWMGIYNGNPAFVFGKDAKNKIFYDGVNPMKQYIETVNFEQQGPPFVWTLSGYDTRTGGATATAIATMSSNGTSNSGANWYKPTTTGIGNSYWVRIRRTAGANPGGATLDTWIALSSTITLSLSATNSTKTSEGTVELSTTSNGSNIVAFFDYYLSAESYAGSIP